MFEVILQSCVELCLFVGFYAIKRSYRGRQKMTVRGLPSAAAPAANQTIDFGNLNEENNCVAVASTDVRIVSSPGDHNTGSSKVRMNNVVDYTWEEKFYAGQLLAVHMRGKYIAYGIKAGGKTQSVIRVVNRETAKRTLIKGVEGNVEDLAFAFIPDRFLLASLDFRGTLLVHNITENATGEITCQLLLTTTPDESVDNINPKRVFWCPFIPDEYDNDKVEDDEGFGWLLAVTRGSKGIELWNVGVVTRNFGPGPHSSKTVSEGFLEIEASTSIISDAAFSPDGTAIATASYDGHCKFYQVYMAGEGEPRQLHEWKPHDGDPVNTLFFLDDHVNTTSDVQFWKYAVTGAKDNTEIKLWSCETWECLQKISFTTRSSRHSRGWGKLKAAIDLSAGYIFLSDMYLRLLYVLELKKDADNVIQPFIQTITEFKLPCPILSFGIVEAGLITYGKTSAFGIEELCNGTGDSEDEPASAVLVRMYLVQPKSLQECHIAFQTSNAIEVHHNILLNVAAPVADKVNELKKEVDEENNTHSAPILMTPDAFHSPHQTATSPSNVVATSSSPAPPKTAVEPQPSAKVTQSESSFPGVGAFISGGSSPSREVQEILSSPGFYSKPTSTTCLQESVIQEAADEKVRSLESSIHSLKADVAGLIELAATQAQELKTLREDLRRNDAVKITEAVDLAVSRAVAATLSNQKRTEVRCSLDPQHFAGQVTSNLNADVSRVLSLTVANQFQQDIKPAISRAVDQMATEIHKGISHTLVLTEQALKDNIGKLLKNKSITDTLNHNLSLAASSALEEVFKDMLMKAGIPVFEKAANAMFQQINHSFSDGLSEYKKEMEGYAMKANDRANVEVAALQTAVENLDSVSKKFSTLVDKEAKRLDDVVAEINRNLNKISLNNGSIRSGAVTPAGHLVDSQVLQAQISQLISQGQINTAFQQALSASDLNLVLYVCDKVGSQQAFNGSGGCLLQQHVLLSLIQQLSADMSHHTETRHKFMEEAIMSLDPTNKNTREYMPGVLTSLSKQLLHYAAANPNGRLTRRVKMLHMATQSLLSQQP